MVPIVINKYLILKRVLIDTGASKSIIKKKNVPVALLNKNKRKASVEWSTNGGKFNAAYEVDSPFMLPEFCPSKEITHTFAVDETENDSKYDAIIGRDLISLLKMDILYSKGCLVWDDISIPMRSAPTVLNSIKRIMSAETD